MSTYSIDFPVANSQQIEAALGHRLEQIRLSRNITQKQLAAESGISLRTLRRLENGEGVTLDTFIRVMSALNIQENLAALLPDPSVRPIERAVSATGTERQRARPREKDSGAGWVWGDEKE